MQRERLRRHVGAHQHGVSVSGNEYSASRKRFSAQELASTAWAFAMTKKWDAAVFAAVAKDSERRQGHFSAQELANTA